MLKAIPKLRAYTNGYAEVQTPVPRVHTARQPKGRGVPKGSGHSLMYQPAWVLPSPAFLWPG